MERSEFGSHISQNLNRDLEELFNEIARMGGLVESQLNNLSDALKYGDMEKAQKALRTDLEINQEEREIDRLCATIIARQQPTASDLRLIIMAVRVAIDLERMGDESVKIANLAMLKAKDNCDCSILPGYQALRKFMNSGKEMMQKTLNGFSRLDTSDVLWVIEEEERMDHLLVEAIAELKIAIAQETDPDNIESLLNMLLSVRAAERVTDHALNVAESVVYLVKGIDIRGLDEAQIKAVLEP